MTPRAALLIAWAAFALIAAAVVIGSAFAQSVSVQIVCDGDLCATTRETMMLIVREIERLKNLIGKDCT